MKVSDPSHVFLHKAPHNMGACFNKANMQEDSEKECKRVCYNLILEVTRDLISLLSYSIH